MAQHKLCEAEAEVESRKLGRKEILTFQRFQLHQASRLADQAQRERARERREREKISLYGELELRSRLFQEDHAKKLKN